jgi:hypothetical protein
MLVALAGILLPMGFVLDDISRARTGGLTAMTAYSTAAVVASFANAVALRAADTPERWTYYLYVSDAHVFVAVCLSLAASVLPPLVFRVIESSPGAVVLHGLLPRVRGEVQDRVLVRGGTLLGLMVVALHWGFPVLPFGTLGSVIFLAPLLVVFTLARAGAERNVTGALAAALLVAGAETLRALLYAFLRGDVVLPTIAFAMGALAGARSLKLLSSKIFLPVYALAVIFVLYFGAFGAMRGKMGAGLSRLQDIQEYQEQAQADPNLRDQTVLSRLTTINQLSQVGRLVDEGGFLHGQTMEYLGYAFIPRFLWPDKPTIAKGAWFALRIGLARILPDGRISNSINMTIPGELYLNFGWMGVCCGMVIVGLAISLLWHTTNFWSQPRNVLGTAFSFYLIWVWLNLGTDLQLFVTLIAVYLVFLALGIAMTSVRHARRSSVASPLLRRSA